MTRKQIDAAWESNMAFLDKVRGRKKEKISLDTPAYDTAIVMLVARIKELEAMLQVTEFPYTERLDMP
jgi:hypothetical protein